VTLTLIGDARALAGPLLAVPGPATVLVPTLSALADGAIDWAARDGGMAAETGTEAGRWECGAPAASGAGEVCTAAPAGCGGEFDRPRCAGSSSSSGGDGHGSDYACLVDGVAGLMPDYSSCSGLLNSLGAAYAEGFVTLNYAADRAVFSGAPNLTFTLRTEPEGAFDWNTLECPAELTCMYPASDEAADAKRLAVTVFAVTAGAGSFAIASPVSTPTKRVALHVGVAVAGHPGTQVVTEGVESVFALSLVACTSGSCSPATQWLDSGTLIGVAVGVVVGGILLVFLVVHLLYKTSCGTCAHASIKSPKDTEQRSLEMV